MLDGATTLSPHNPEVGKIHTILGGPARSCSGPAGFGFSGRGEGEHLKEQSVFTFSAPRRPLRMSNLRSASPTSTGGRARNKAFLSTLSPTTPDYNSQWF